MTVTTDSKLVTQIDSLAETAREVADRRDRHAAALWMIHDFLLELPVPIRVIDSPVGDDYPVKLAFAPDLECVGVDPGADRRWRLTITCDEGTFPAERAPARAQTEALRRIPEFLDKLAVALRGAAGTSVTRDYAMEIVQTLSARRQRD